MSPLKFSCLSPADASCKGSPGIFHRCLRGSKRSGVRRPKASSAERGSRGSGRRGCRPQLITGCAVKRRPQ